MSPPDEYRDEAVNRILAAKDGPNDPTAPTDPAKFIEWLHGPETVSKQPDQTAAHSPECWKRVYNPNGKCDCGLETNCEEHSALGAQTKVRSLVGTAAPDADSQLKTGAVK